MTTPAGENLNESDETDSEACTSGVISETSLSTSENESVSPKKDYAQLCVETNTLRHSQERQTENCHTRRTIQPTVTSKQHQNTPSPCAGQNGSIVQSSKDGTEIAKRKRLSLKKTSAGQDVDRMLNESASSDENITQPNRDLIIIYDSDSSANSEKKCSFSVPAKEIKMAYESNNQQTNNSSSSVPRKRQSLHMKAQFSKTSKFSSDESEFEDIYQSQSRFFQRQRKPRNESLHTTALFKGKIEAVNISRITVSSDDDDFQTQRVFSQRKPTKLSSSPSSSQAQSRTIHPEPTIAVFENKELLLESNDLVLNEEVNGKENPENTKKSSSLSLSDSSDSENILKTTPSQLAYEFEPSNSETFKYEPSNTPSSGKEPCPIGTSANRSVNPGKVKAIAHSLKNINVKVKEKLQHAKNKVLGPSRNSSDVLVVSEKSGTHRVKKKTPKANVDNNLTEMTDITSDIQTAIVISDVDSDDQSSSNKSQNLPFSLRSIPDSITKCQIDSLIKYKTGSEVNVTSGQQVNCAESSVGSPSDSSSSLFKNYTQLLAKSLSDSISPEVPFQDEKMEQAASLACGNLDLSHKLKRDKDSSKSSNDTIRSMPSLEITLPYNVKTKLEEISPPILTQYPVSDFTFESVRPQKSASSVLLSYKKPNNLKEAEMSLDAEEQWLLPSDTIRSMPSLEITLPYNLETKLEEISPPILTQYPVSDFTLEPVRPQKSASSVLLSYKKPNNLKEAEMSLDAEEQKLLPIDLSEHTCLGETQTELENENNLLEKIELTLAMLTQTGISPAPDRECMSLAAVKIEPGEAASDRECTSLATVKIEPDEEIAPCYSKIDDDIYVYDSDDEALFQTQSISMSPMDKEASSNKKVQALKKTNSEMPSSGDEDSSSAGSDIYLEPGEDESCELPSYRYGDDDLNTQDPAHGSDTDSNTVYGHFPSYRYDGDDDLNTQDPAHGSDTDSNTIYGQPTQIPSLDEEHKPFKSFSDDDDDDDKYGLLTQIDFVYDDDDDILFFTKTQMESDAQGGSMEKEKLKIEINENITFKKDTVDGSPSGEGSLNPDWLETLADSSSDKAPSTGETDDDAYNLATQFKPPSSCSNKIDPVSYRDSAEYAQMTQINAVSHEDDKDFSSAKTQVDPAASSSAEAKSTPMMDSRDLASEVDPFAVATQAYSPLAVATQADSPAIYQDDTNKNNSHAVEMEGDPYQRETLMDTEEPEGFPGNNNDPYNDETLRDSPSDDDCVYGSETQFDTPEKSVGLPKNNNETLKDSLSDNEDMYANQTQYDTPEKSVGLPKNNNETLKDSLSETSDSEDMYANQTQYNTPEEFTGLPKNNNETLKDSLSETSDNEDMYANQTQYNTPEKSAGLPKNNIETLKYSLSETSDNEDMYANQTQYDTPEKSAGLPKNNIETLKYSLGETSDNEDMYANQTQYDTPEKSAGLPKNNIETLKYSLSETSDNENMHANQTQYDTPEESPKLSKNIIAPYNAETLVESLNELNDNENLYANDTQHGTYLEAANNSSDPSLNTYISSPLQSNVPSSMQTRECVHKSRSLSAVQIDKASEEKENEKDKVFSQDLVGPQSSNAIKRSADINNHAESTVKKARISDSICLEKADDKLKHTDPEVILAKQNVLLDKTRMPKISVCDESEKNWHTTNKQSQKVQNRDLDAKTIGETRKNLAFDSNKPEKNVNESVKTVQNIHYKDLDPKATEKIRKCLANLLVSPNDYRLRQPYMKSFSVLVPSEVKSGPIFMSSERESGSVPPGDTKEVGSTDLGKTVDETESSNPVHYPKAPLTQPDMSGHSTFEESSRGRLDMRKGTEEIPCNASNDKLVDETQRLDKKASVHSVTNTDANSSSLSKKRPLYKTSGASQKRPCLEPTHFINSDEHQEGDKQAQLTQNIRENDKLCTMSSLPKKNAGESKLVKPSLSVMVNSKKKSKERSSLPRKLPYKSRKPSEKTVVKEEKFNNQLAIARQQLAERKARSFTTPAVKDRRTSNLHVKADNQNDLTDVEMPCTQEIMDQGLPLLSSKLTVGKRHLSFGLPEEENATSPELSESTDHEKEIQRVATTVVAEVVCETSVANSLQPASRPHVASLQTVSHNIQDGASTKAEDTFREQSETLSAGTTLITTNDTFHFSEHGTARTHSSVSENGTAKAHSTVSKYETARSQSSFPVSDTSAVTLPASRRVVKSTAFSVGKSTKSARGFQLARPSAVPNFQPTIERKGILKTIIPQPEHLPRAKYDVIFNDTFNKVHEIEQLKPNQSRGTPENGAKPKLNVHLDFLFIALNWRPEWLVEEEKVKKLPPLFGGNQDLDSVCSQLRMYYTEVKEYVEITKNLLILEFWAMILRDWKSSKTSQNIKLEVQMIDVPFKSNEEFRKRALCQVTVVGAVAEAHQMKLPSEDDFLIMDVWGVSKLNDKSAPPDWFQQFAYVKTIHHKRVEKKWFLSHHKLFDSSTAVNDLPGTVLTFTMKLVYRHRGVFFNQKLMKIKNLSTLTTTVREVDALMTFLDNRLCGHLLNPLQNSVFYHDSIDQGINHHSGLNTEQASAVASIRRAVKGHPEDLKVFLLHGPPGTGKSHTLMSLIYRILEDSLYKARICLAAPSNAAVDELAKRLIKMSGSLKAQGRRPISVVRIGNSQSIHPEVQMCSWRSLEEQTRFQTRIQNAPDNVKAELDCYKSEAEELEKHLLSSNLKEIQKLSKKAKLEEVKRNIKRLQDEIVTKNVSKREKYTAQCQVLDQAHVICGTLSSFGAERAKQILLRQEDHPHKAQPFTCLIIDEATQAIEVDCFIPLHYKITKLVLVGDQEQLPATVLSQKAVNNKLDRSLFERLLLCFRKHYQENPDKDLPVMRLMTQYRMHDEILSLPNDLFYGGKLTTDRSVQKREQHLAPYLIFDTLKSRETREGHFRSVSNIDEAQCTVQLCCLIIELLKIKPHSSHWKIGVICPYADQKQAILKCLRDRQLGNIEVNTVDGFQGQERDVIIMSCVRAQSSPTGIGFVADRRRMNVALTRAKRALYVIGHFKTLCLDEFWKELYQNAQRRNLLVEVPKPSDFHSLAKQHMQVARSRTQSYVVSDNSARDNSHQANTAEINCRPEQNTQGDLCSYKGEKRYHTFNRVNEIPESSAGNNINRSVFCDKEKGSSYSYNKTETNPKSNSGISRSVSYEKNSRKSHSYNRTNKS